MIECVQERVYKDLIISTIVDFGNLYLKPNAVYKDLIISTIVDSFNQKLLKI